MNGLGSGGDAIEQATSAEALAQQTMLDVSAASLPADPAPVKRPIVGKIKPFHIEHTSPDGTVYSGDFTNRIRTIGDKIAIGVLKGKLLTSDPPISLDIIDADTQWLVHRIAHMMCTLTVRPDWFQDIIGITDEGLIDAVFTEVAAHEAMFREQRQAAS